MFYIYKNSDFNLYNEDTLINKVFKLVNNFNKVCNN
jgi:hypothetical protein